MAKDVDIFHHIGLIARDMDAVVARYEALGFRFTPVSMARIPLRPGGEPEPLGAGNRCAIFEDNYLEVLGVLDAARWASITPEQRGPFDIDVPLARYEGLHVMHFGADDLEVVRARLVAHGVRMSEIRPFQRMVDTLEGPKMMRAAAMHFPHGSNPEGLVQMVQHLTPELVLQPRYMDHPNGVRSIRGVLLCCEDPAELAAKYERYTDVASRIVDGDHFIDLARGRLVLTSPRGVSKWIPGYHAPVLPMLVGFVLEARLDATERVLCNSGVPFEAHRTGFLVRPEHAYGSAILFTEKAT